MLRYLLNFWLYPIFGMFLAAGATIGDVGTGGGDGGDAGAGDAGDGSGADQDDSGDSGDDGSSADGSQDGADTQDGDAADGEEGSIADPDAPVDLGDGRTVPGKWKKLFDQAAKAGLGKEVKQLYFAQQRLAKAIPGGVNGAIALAKTVDEMGGVEGIEQLQSNLEAYTADEGLFENNQQKWVEAGFEHNSEAALKAFDHTLQYVADKHPDHYDYRAAGIIVADLNNLDVRGIHGILAAIKDNPEATRLAKQLADYYNSRVETSKQAPENKPDAQSKALTDRETAVKKQEMDVRYKQVNSEVFPSLKAEVTKTLRTEAKASGIDIDKLSKEYPAEWRNMLNEIHREIMVAVTKDQRFIDKYFALVEKGELKRAAKAVNDKHAAIAADIVRKVKATYGVFRGKKAGAKPGADKGAKPGAQGAQPQNAGWLRVSKKPEHSSINWSKTTSAMQLDGKYILNDGKKVVVAY